jgi:membrane-bound lytic murein transglycosylase B
MQQHVPAHADPANALVRLHMPVWTSRKRRLAIASVVVASALSLGGAGVTAHRVGAESERTASSASSSAGPNSGVPFAAGAASDPSSPMPPTSSPGGPNRTPQPTPAVPSVPSAPQLAADGIPAVALDAYRKAAARVAATYPGCGLPWPLLAAIGRVESDHGRFAGSQLYTDGTDAPRVIGIPLNGHGTALIRDTDHGLLDGDTVYDRAVGPMQFIPSTWATWGVDGNGDGVVSPFNIYDAALAAADYLCSAGGNLQTAAGQIRAVLAYNHSDAYLATVLALEKVYATGQPGVTIPILPSVPKPPAHQKPLPPPVNPGPPLGLTTPRSPSQPGSGPGSTSSRSPGSTPGSGSTSPTAPSSGGSTPPGSPGAPPTWSRTSPPGSGTSAPPSSSTPPPPTDAPPTADLSVAQTAGGGPLDVTADASKSTDDKSGLTYTFDFGDGTAAVGPQPEPTAPHTYAAGGTYTVTVTVTDSAGQTSTKTQDITVTAPAAATADISSAATGNTPAASTDGSSSTPSQSG